MDITGTLITRVALLTEDILRMSAELREIKLLLSEEESKEKKKYNTQLRIVRTMKS